MKTRRGTDERSKLIRSLDRITPKIVKLRDGYTCQRCGRLLQVGLREWAHIFRRGHMTLRWIVDNAITACQDCHRWIDLHPKEAKEWFEQKFPIRMAYLQALYMIPVYEIRTDELTRLLDENKIELKRLKAEFK